VLLHNGACSPGAKQACMKSIEIKHAGVSAELHSNMEVRGIFCVIHGRGRAELQENHMELVLAAAAWESAFHLTSRALPPSVGFLAVSPVLA
jgi:hypothetical protein